VEQLANEVLSLQSTSRAGATTEEEEEKGKKKKEEKKSV